MNTNSPNKGPKTYFKAVSLGTGAAHGKRFSYNISLYSQCDPQTTFKKLEHVPGVPTTPVIAGFKLFIFDTLENAQRNCGVNVEIWECEATGVTRLPYYDIFGIDFPDSDSIWTRRAKHRNVKSLGRGIKGTLVADSVTLVRKVW